MVGDFYTYDAAKASPRALPAYFDSGLFVFDWMRNWMRVVRLDAHDKFLRTEPFMSSNGDFRRPIDAAFSPEGFLYVLEYGSVYGIDNPDARLVRIEYNAGNRPPVARAGMRDMLVPKLSAINAACGPYCMSWKISDTTIASSTSPAIRVLSNPKYGKANSPVQTIPMPYISLRPIRSEMWPNSGTLINPTAAAMRVSVSNPVRPSFSCVVP